MARGSYLLYEGDKSPYDDDGQCIMGNNQFINGQIGLILKLHWFPEGTKSQLIKILTQDGSIGWADKSCCVKLQ